MSSHVRMVQHTNEPTLEARGHPFDSFISHQDDFTFFARNLTLNVFNYIMLMHREEVAVMKTQTRFVDYVKTNYMVVVIAVLGVFAFLSAVLIAWPAVAYIASKLFVH